MHWLEFIPFPVAIAKGPHPFPFRTRKLSPSAPMVLHGQLGGRVGRRREFFQKPLIDKEVGEGLFFIQGQFRRGDFFDLFG